MAASRKPSYDLSKVDTQDLELPGSRHPPPPAASSRPPAPLPSVTNPTIPRQAPWRKIFVRRGSVSSVPSIPDSLPSIPDLPRQSNASIFANIVLLILGVAASGAALGRFAHRAAGWNPVPLARAALEGRSVLWSSVASLVAVALTVTFGIVSRYARPKSTGFLVAALALFIIAFSFGFIALTVGSTDAPPDAAPLVRWALPVVVLGVALRALGNGGRGCLVREGSGRLRGTFQGALAAALAFVAVELLFGAGLGRFLAWLHPR